ncbi:hypothetical protein J3R30DRAFT_3695629 [Lentinula aciculospora]|uniref:Uncharacterized protein n=1 Tax=Lentinula aciculospora TaxID=153920 RepID=A0A9W9AT34_9AGAR|nr:hypothetical protein J3R30DRAFT_3695629 [Lentinula aciculospora]
MNPAAPRAPSPLRQSATRHGGTTTGIDPDSHFVNSDSDDDSDDEREQDSAASVTQLAASFANKFGNFVGGMTSPSPSPSPGALMMSSSEIEKEAQRERERGRREAERILQAESQRTSLEDRVLAMLDSTRALPPPPSRSQTMPNPESSQPSSPSSNVSWWSAAKNRLTPTKDKDLTPAQQVILDVKRGEKEREKAEKEYQKEIKRSSKGKEKEWPAVAETKYSDPAFFNLNVPQTPTPQHRRTGSPTSPSPNTNSSPGRVLGSPSASGSPARSFAAPNLTPSPNRSTTSTGAGASPGRDEQPPLYAQFNPQGGLDVHLTFEKLEKWTVGHVRALEERMGDVERWLVDKEAREQRNNGQDSEGDATKSFPNNQISNRDQGEGVRNEVQNLRDEMLELQGRIGEIGREMAEMGRERAFEKVMPEKLSSSKQSQPTKIREASPPPTSSSFALVESVSPGTSDWPNLQSHKRVPSVRESTSPPLMRSLSRQTTGSRLPYPTGDYAPIPLDADAVMSGTFSPPASPPGSLNSRTPTKKITLGMQASSSYAPSGIGLGLANSASFGVPAVSSSASTYSTSYSNASFSSVSSISPSTSPSPSPRPRGPQQTGTVNASPSTAPKGRVLPVPPSSAKDQQSSSTSPSGGRKRYTVALGTPITRASAMMASENASESSPVNDGTEEHSRPPRKGSNSSIGRAFFSSSPVSVGRDERSDEEADDFVGEETIGKSSSRSGLAAALKEKKNNQESTDSFTPTHSRLRAQSAYGFSSIVQQSPSQGRDSAFLQSINSNGGSIAPLKPRVRSQSTSPHPSTSIVSPPSSSKFVDPLVTRKQEAQTTKHGKLAMPRPLSGKIPIGQLVKFFDGDAKK